MEMRGFTLIRFLIAVAILSAPIAIIAPPMYGGAPSGARDSVARLPTGAYLLPPYVLELTITPRPVTGIAPEGETRQVSGCVETAAPDNAARRLPVCYKATVGH
jgi:hypothetical protein